MSRPLALILTLYFLLAAGYGIASPPFETPDENLLSLIHISEPTRPY